MSHRVLSHPGSLNHQRTSIHIFTPTRTCGVSSTPPNVTRSMVDRAHTLQVLLLLLYGTGLRISEALNLTLADFDLNAGVFTIRESKFYKSRFVLLAQTCTISFGVTSPSSGRRDAFRRLLPLLATRRATPIVRRTAEGAFQCLRKEACISRPGGPRNHPDCMTCAIPSQLYVLSRGIARVRRPTPATSLVHLSRALQDPAHPTLPHHDHRAATRSQSLLRALCHAGGVSCLTLVC